MSLFDTPMDVLFHFPETVEKMMFPPPPQRSQQDGVHHRQHCGGGGQAHGQQEESKGFGSVPVDIVETPKEYTFYFDVPGLSKSDIQVSLEEEEKILVIKSSVKRKREDGEEEGSCKYLRLERKASPKFLRKFRLPDDSNPAAITAKCEHGVLTVVVEKLPPPPESKPKTVEVAIA